MTSAQDGLHPETLAISFGYDPQGAYGAAKPPIFLTSTFVYPSAEHAKAVHAALVTETVELAGSLLHQATKDIEAALFERVFDQ